MKKLLSVLLALTMLFAFASCGGGKTPTDADTSTDAAKTLRISTTTSVENSGLLSYLLPTFEAAYGYKVEVSAKGTGEAIKAAKDGNADLILVHAKASEEEFVNEGYGVERIPFMYNYFVIVGPKDDPAGIKDCATAADAFKMIASNEAKFVSRGDDSGTHKAENKIWGEAVPNAETDKWYINAGTGMGACLTMASEQGAYCLTDKATYLSHKAELELDILLGESEDMKNTYSLIECNPERLDGIDTEGAKAFIEWMTGEEASALIEKFGVEEYGEGLFFLLEE